MLRLGAALGAVLLIAVGGCNNGEEPKESGPEGSTKLTITVMAEGGAPSTEFTLECDPPRGDHPQPAEACAKFKKAGPRVFDPVPKDQACTMIFGGPQTATVIGMLDNVPVSGSFNRSNGCEIDRWEKLGTTVFDVPLQ